jgi:hypothetical protein
MLYLVIMVVTRRRQRLLSWRKQLAALLAVRDGPGQLAALLEDDEAFGLLLQRFLGEHQVPYTLPLYDEHGRYLFAAPEKIAVLSRALLQAVGKGHDNELFVLLVDLLELDQHLGPLLQAVRVALARHHQVVLVCPWPPGVPPPSADAAPSLPLPSPPEGAEGRGREGAGANIRELLHQATAVRTHDAYRRLRRAFARLGVPVVCAAGNEPVPLILDRLDRLRAVRRNNRR